jgi:hypothetical protein
MNELHALPVFTALRFGASGSALNHAHHVQVSMVTLNFWFDLEEYLVSSPNGKPKREPYTPVCASDSARPVGVHVSHTDGLRMCGVVRVHACVARQVFRHLLPLLVQASRFPEDFDNLPKGSPAPPRRMIRMLAVCVTLSLLTDLRDEFLEFRNEVKDTMLYVQLVLEAGTWPLSLSLSGPLLRAPQAFDPKSQLPILGSSQRRWRSSFRSCRRSWPRCRSRAWAKLN